MSTCRGSDRGIEPLVTAVVMQEMPARELARQLKDIYRDLKLIYMSGCTHRDFALDLDAEAILLQKPFSIAVLRDTVRNILDRTALA